VIRGTKGQKVFKNSECRYALGLDSQWYTISSDNDITVIGRDTKTIKTQFNDKKIATSDGIKTLVPTDRLMILGADNQKKTVSSGSSSYRITGKGWGHAIGMSQEGAKGMAKAGYKYNQILEYYFQGTKVE